MGENDKIGSSLEPKCFICLGNSRTPLVSNFCTNQFLSSGDACCMKRNLPKSLNDQLCVTLLLRNILGIHQVTLSELVETAGSPSNWGIHLCGACLAIFKEAEFTHRRLIKFRTDFQTLAKELRTTLQHSATSSDVGGSLNQNSSTACVEEPIKVVRKAGRPRSKKNQPTPAIITQSDTPVNILRSKFFAADRSSDDAFTNKLFVTRSIGSILDNICTTQPIQVTISDRLHLLDDEEHPNVAIGKLSKPNKSKETAKPVEFSSKQKNIVSHSVDDDTGHEKTPDEILNVNVQKIRIKQERCDFQLDQDQDANEVDFQLDQDADEIANDDDNTCDIDPPSPEPNWTPENSGAESVSDVSESDDDDWGKTLSKKKKISKTVKKRNRPGYFRSEKMGEEINVQPELENGSYKCPKCAENFDRKFDCRAHILESHFDDSYPFHCHICNNKRFTTEKYLRRHMKRFHMNAKNPYDDDYDPNLHSREKMMSLLDNDKTWVSSDVHGSTEVEDKDAFVNNLLGQSVPWEVSEQVDIRLPADVMAKFRSHPSKRSDCRECQRKFPSEMLRDAHEKRAHQGIERAFSCDKCPKNFPRRAMLLKHVVLVHYGSKHVCKLCGYRFTDALLLEGHVRRMHLGERNPFECKLCQRRFCRKVKLDTHMTKAHGFRKPSSQRKLLTADMISFDKVVPPIAEEDLEKELECWVCSTDGIPIKFGSVEEKDEHVQAVHTSVQKPHKCTVEGCDKVYAKEVHLETHLRKVHEIITPKNEEEIKRFCAACDKHFKTKAAYKVHMSNSHEGAHVVCDICGKHFKMQKYLDDHQQRVHHKELNIQPYRCNICGKILNTARSLDHHIKMKHTKETKFKCKLCDYGSMFDTNLKRHMEVRHLKISKAMCHICSRPFATQFYLTQHILRVHTGEKPFKCKECDKEFSDKSTFNRHVEAHAGHIHECPVETCGKKFNTRHAFRIHLKLHRKNGIMVQIPEFRYNTLESDDDRAGKSNTDVTAASSTFTSTFEDLPDLKSETEPQVNYEPFKTTDPVLPVLNSSDCLGQHSTPETDLLPPILQNECILPV